ncbi:MAG TPA: hypothetical protein VEP90_10940, partial [Methylomirabilota bacterium]|nr:hypothetical protein [Methylomirabilota bacterium]
SLSLLERSERTFLFILQHFSKNVKSFRNELSKFVVKSEKLVVKVQYFVVKYVIIDIRKRSATATQATAHEKEVSYEKENEQKSRYQKRRNIGCS